MSDEGELFVTETLRDEIEERAKVVNVRMPDYFHVSDRDMAGPLMPEDIKPGYKGQATIYDCDGERAGTVAYSLVLNPDYSGDPMDELAIVGDIFVVLCRL